MEYDAQLPTSCVISLCDCNQGEEQIMSSLAVTICKESVMKTFPSQEGKTKHLKPIGIGIF
jgi:hypothetical protein